MTGLHRLKIRLTALLAMLPLLLSSSSFEPMPPPAGADLSPYILTCPLTVPTDYRSVTDRFGWRFHPIGGTLDFHTGLDLAADEGAAVRAALGGTVAVSDTHESYGNYIVIDHGSGFSTLYAHCSRLLVREGKRVAPGQRIALVGQTGDATGPHLHFEMIRNSVRLDPLPALEGRKH